jgi:hypothetical protein
MKTNGVDEKIYVFSTSALVVGEWLAVRSSRFTPGERAHRTDGMGGLVGPRAGLDPVEKRKFCTLLALGLWSFSRPARSQSLYRLRYLTIRSVLWLYNNASSFAGVIQCPMKWEDACVLQLEEAVATYFKVWRVLSFVLYRLKVWWRASSGLKNRPSQMQPEADADS